MALTYTAAQLSKFAKTLKIPVTPARVNELVESKHLTTPVSFFEFTAPELKEAGWGGKEAVSYVSGTNKVRKQFADVAVCAVIEKLSAAVAKKLLAHTDSVTELSTLKAAQIVEVAGVEAAEGKRLAVAFKEAQEVLEGLDGELQLKVR